VSWRYQIDSCECCDLSIDDLRKLLSVVSIAIASHEPWPDSDEGTEKPGPMWVVDGTAGGKP
jgi:hypothetical protein